jgi:alanyl-tRNA synthetase
MSQWTSAAIRSSFLSFFKEREHTIVASAPLIPIDDPTLLFTNAGMNQFKDVFLGLATREYTRVADTQKCMRVSGKHNDLEEVGHDGTHHTFFEMLGNWSFGDYYKKEAIGWAWELLTEVWGLSKERLYATVFKDELDELDTDEEAAGYWRTETDIDPDHILYFGRGDNFWEMADTGPCGPNSEISIDRGPAFCDQQDVPGHHCQVNGDCGRFVELWNLVFIQYNRVDAQTLEPLPAKHVDTGAGFERLVSVLQNTHTNYDTDLFGPILERTQELLGHTDAQREENIVAYRVIADHGRAITFLVGDGVIPGNEGREYVLRMILRRAARFGRKIGFDRPFLAEIAGVVIDNMGPHFSELATRRDFVLTTITQEEERFMRTIDRGLERMVELVQAAQGAGQDTISGHDAFVLWTQDGFPYDLIRDIAGENGLSVDRAGFEGAMEEHRQISGQGGMGEIDVGTLSVYRRLLEELQAQGALPAEGVVARHDEQLELEAPVLALLRVSPPAEGDSGDAQLERVEQVKRVQSAQPGDRVEVVLAETPFYVEGGGQVSDTGLIAGGTELGGSDSLGREDDRSWVIEVEGARRPVPGLIVHVGRVDDGRPSVGEQAWVIVDQDLRMDTARNHTATHLLHSELRYALGEHVQQAGSLVTADRLRFDFSHGGMLVKDQLSEVERLVNAAILADYPVEVAHERYAEAVAGGAMALFGEKYGDDVRVIKIGYEDDEFSKELCGGTHVTHTSQIGLFRILSESSVAAGVRRIEAVTGTAAQSLAQERLDVLDEASAYLGCQAEAVGRKVLSLLDDQQQLRKEIERLNRELARRRFVSVLDKAEKVEGVSVLAAQVDVPNVETLREMCDWFRERIGSGVIVLGTVISGQPSLVAAVTEDLVARGLDAGRMVKEVARTVGGGGGGKPTMAHAGGRDAAKLSAALARVPDLVRAGLAPAGPAPESQ